MVAKVTANAYDNNLARFPSPCGVMVAKANENCLTFASLMFPSPCGVMVAKEESMDELPMGKNELVSVPLRGNGCERIKSR